MKKYAIIINDETKECRVGTGDNAEFYQSLGMSETDVEQASNGAWYVSGFAPALPEKGYAEKRRAEYPSVEDQLDMIYWDKINGTSVWQDTITAVKTKYPKG